MTVKLYETDGMLAKIKATVTGAAQKDGAYYITLDKTIFAPEGGGQKADTGTLVTVNDGTNASGAGDIQLLDGQDRVKDLALEGPVYRISEPLSVGDEILCKLNWEQRFMRMQQHSGEHILSGLIHSNFGYENISFHLSDIEPVILCFNGVLNADDISRMERLANEAVWQDLPITASFPSAEELAAITYRSKKELKGQVRLVTIPGIDVCACCAPHLPTTGRIGLIKILSSCAYKGGTQLNILCGGRALELVQKEHAQFMELGREYSTSLEKLPQVILSQKEELKTAREQLAAYTEAQLLSQIDALKDTDVPCLFGENLSPHAMKICYNALCKKFDRFCGVFSKTGKDSYQFYAGHSSRNSTEIAPLMRVRLGVMGGGSKEMIQGKVQRKEEEIRLFFRDLSEYV